MNDETETSDLIKIFQQFGIYRNSLSKEHNEFVRQRLQKDYDTVTKTYELQGKVYTGTFREDSHRKENREAYAKEAKLATVLASMGFDVILIEENSAQTGTKPDAIVNGIVMDFKEIDALSEKEAGKNTLANNYRKAMHKRNTEGVVIFLHSFSEKYVFKNMESRTSEHHNGLALFFHEDTGSLQLIDMQKIRAIHKERPTLAYRPERLPNSPFHEDSSTSAKSSFLNSNIPHSPEKSSIKSTIPAKSLEDMVYKGAAVTIGNQTIKCRHGLLEEFRKNYHQLEAEREINRSLTEQVSELKKQIDEQRQNPRQVRRSDDFGMEY